MSTLNSIVVSFNLEIVRRLASSNAVVPNKTMMSMMMTSFNRAILSALAVSPNCTPVPKPKDSSNSKSEIKSVKNNIGRKKRNLPSIPSKPLIKNICNSSKRGRDDPTTTWVEYVEIPKRRKKMMSSEQILAQFGLTEASFDHCYGPRIPIRPFPELPAKSLREDDGCIYQPVGKFCEDGKNWVTLVSKIYPKVSE